MDLGPERSSLATSASLLERARGQDAEAWRKLTALYGPLVYKWARSAGLKEHDAADVVQDVFLAVHRGLDRFRKERTGDHFRSWLFTIARRRTCDALRSRNGSAVAVGGSEAQGLWRELPESREPSEEAGPGELDEVVRRALEMVRGEFEERTYLACLRTAVEGKTAAEVGQELGMAVGTVYVARCRVLKRLREFLDGAV